MSLAMEETTFHVGKPLPSAQSAPGEKGHVNVVAASSPAERGRLPGLKPHLSRPEDVKCLQFFLSLCFPFKGGLIEVVIESRCHSVFIFHARSHGGRSPFRAPLDLPPMLSSTVSDFGGWCCACACDVVELGRAVSL